MDKILTKKTWILAMMVVFGFSLVWLIPNSGEFRESKLVADLPDDLAERKGIELEISAEERKVLAEDTTFSRKRYFDKSLDAKSFIDISVVFSGKDINNSIHRPEICLKAQGWNFESEKYVSFTKDDMTFPFKEIVCSRPRQESENRPYRDSKGQIIVDRRVQYYAFVGAEIMVAGHYERTWEDIKMRILKGTDQQWAYITISMDITESAKDDPNGLGQFKLLNLEETKAVLKEFTTQTLPLLLEN